MTQETPQEESKRIIEQAQASVDRRTAVEKLMDQERRAQQPEPSNKKHEISIG